ncbi:MAG: alpha/beta hydrolase [Acutalibacteraceae bacterium]|nr:alpha/beta hydrolase [Acutalibacteraceae bacterium]
MVVYFAARYFFRFTILRKPTATIDNNDVNANTNWEQHLDFIRSRKAWLAGQETEDIYIKSFDGLKLHGTLLSTGNNKNCVICFHGFTSRGLNDYGAMAKFYHEQDFNVIMTDARNHGESEGEYTGFGVLDRHDAVRWIDYAVKRFGEDVNIFLHGDSMGGATVLMASGLDLPANVKAIISDCAFTSAYDVFSHVIKRDYHIPKFPVMNIAEKMTKKKAGYSYSDVSTLDEVAKTRIPVLFIHGEIDDFVPVWMTEKNYEACNSEKELLLVKGADHAESYYVDTDQFEGAVKRMIDKYT